MFDPTPRDLALLLDMKRHDLFLHYIHNVIEFLHLLRNQEAYEFAEFSDDEEEEVEDEKSYTYQSTLFVSKAIHGGDEGTGFAPNDHFQAETVTVHHTAYDAEPPEECSGSEAVTACSSPAAVEPRGPSDDDDDEEVQPKIPSTEDFDSSYDDSDGNSKLGPTLYFHRNIKNSVFVNSDIDNFLGT